MDKEFELIVSDGLLLGQRVLRINEETITYHDLQMDCKEVVTFGYEAAKIRRGGLQLHISTQYRICIQDSSGDVMEITFMNGSLTDAAARTEDYHAIIEQIWKYFGQRLLNESIAAISSGDGWDLGGITCDREGVHFIQSGFFGRKTERIIKWNHVRFSMDDEVLDFKSAIDSDCFLRVRTISNDVHILAALFAATLRDRNMVDYLTGKKQFQY